ncbi:MAG: hypothetical protein K2N85_02460, partial [Lachnospiraceae bacterium]|nr:hypothetical protein [Lachnospiraceae bacterium]
MAMEYTEEQLNNLDRAVLVQLFLAQQSQRSKPKHKKPKGRRAADIKGLPVIPVKHMMTKEELIAEFGENGWYQLEDEIYNRYKFTPMK